MIQRKPMDTCKLVNVWLGENLAHARALGPKPITTRSGAKLECHQVVNMYIRVFSSRRYEMRAIVSNTSATGGNSGKDSKSLIQYIKRGKLVSRTETEELLE
jgi:hypothetical protein